jgi:hypothetical protein
MAGIKTSGEFWLIPVFFEHVA